MPLAIALTKRNDIAIKLTLARDPQEIANEEYISVRSVRRFRKNLIHHGHTYAGNDIPRGRRRLITPEMEQIHIDWL